MPALLVGSQREPHITRQLIKIACGLDKLVLVLQHFLPHLAVFKPAVIRVGIHIHPGGGQDGTEKV